MNETNSNFGGDGGAVRLFMPRARKLLWNGNVNGLNGDLARDGVVRRRGRLQRGNASGVAVTSKLFSRF